MNFRVSLQRLIALVGVLVLLSGCVTVPVNSTRDIDQAVEDHVAAAMEYLQRGYPGEARRHVTRALELRPESALAHNAMGLLYRYEGALDKAAHHFRLALEYDSGFSPARNNLGVLLYNRGKYLKAAHHFRLAATDPNYGSRGKAFANLGEALMAAGKVDKAREALKHATILLRRSMRPQLELARSYFMTEAYRRARRYYQVYVHGTKTQSASALWLGIRIAHQLGDEDQQASYALALKRLYPESRQYQLWMQWDHRILETGSGGAGGSE